MTGYGGGVGHRAGRRAVARVCEALLRDYYVDVSDRWYQRAEGRDSTPEEIEAGFPGCAATTWRHRRGVRRGAARGRCHGPRRLRRVAAAEDAPDGAWRSCGASTCGPSSAVAGLGASLLLCAEEIARVWGVSAMRLDTRLDLGEARALYLRQGWVEVPAFSDDFYAEVWYAKTSDLSSQARCRSRWSGVRGRQRS